MRRALAALVAQIRDDGLQGSVQLCVSDNASPDGTAEVVRALSEEAGGGIVYERLPENRGFARNFFNAAGLATGEFVAFCGDDDAIFPGGLARLLEGIGHGADVVLMNTYPGELVKARALPAGIVRSLPDAAAANALLGIFHPSFIGNVVMRRSVFARHADPALARSAYPHVGIVLRALRETPGVFVNTPVFEVETGLRQWQAYQPVYASVDMARLQTEEVLAHAAHPRRAVWRTYWKLIKSVPRAVLALRAGQTRNDLGNPYAELSLKNLLACYRCSRLFQGLCAVLWWGAHVCPRRVLHRICGARGAASRMAPGPLPAAVP